MFVAWRELRFARGRFVLIGAVVALISMLVGFLTGLTGGLASQNVSALLGLPGDRIVLQHSATGTSTFSQSSIPQGAIDQWEGAPGVTSVLPVGIATTRATHGGTTAAVSLFGLPAGGPASTVGALAPRADDQVGISSGAANALGVGRGDRLTIAEHVFEVTTVGGDAWFSHTPVIALTPTAWSTIDKGVGGTGEATLLSVSGSPDWSALAQHTGTSAMKPFASLSSLESFRSEIGSLGLMIAMLFGISALVIGAFFTVWTMQRAGDIAVLKALGATTRALVLDTLGQALFVLLIGVGLGMTLVVTLGLLARNALPFMLNLLTTAAPAAVLILLGLLGASVALRSITRADPLSALGSNR